MRKVDLQLNWIFENFLDMLSPFAGAKVSIVLVRI